MRAGRGLRVILHGKCPLIFDLYAFYGIVIQVDMGNLYLRMVCGSVITYAKAVVL